MKAGYGGVAGGNKETPGELPSNAWMSPGLSDPEQRDSVQQSLPSRVGRAWVEGLCSPLVCCAGASLVRACLWLHDACFRGSSKTSSQPAWAEPMDGLRVAGLWAS